MPISLTLIYNSRQEMEILDSLKCNIWSFHAFRCICCDIYVCNDFHVCILLNMYMFKGLYPGMKEALLIIDVNI